MALLPRSNAAAQRAGSEGALPMVSIWRCLSELRFAW